MPRLYAPVSSSAQDCAWLIAEAELANRFRPNLNDIEAATAELLRISKKHYPTSQKAQKERDRVGPQRGVTARRDIAGLAAKSTETTEAPSNTHLTQTSTANGDSSSFGKYLEQLDETSGILVAMPHGGPLLAAARKVLDGTQTSRAVTFTVDMSVAEDLARGYGFEFTEIVSANPSRLVTDTIVLNQAGTKRAARRLRAGGVVFVLADIVNDLSKAVSVPWRGGARSVMRGAAWLSLAGHAALIAAAPIQDDQGAATVIWEKVADQDPQPWRPLASYHRTIALWKSFERLHDRGATQLTENYEIFRPAPLRAILDSIQSEEQLVRAIEALINPYPVIIGESAGLGSLLRDLRERSSGDALRLASPG